MTLKQCLRDWSKHSVVAYKAYLMVHEMNLRRMEKMDNEALAKWMYSKHSSNNLNLSYPQTFDEKLWWLKFHYHNPLQTLCSDKYKVRDYVSACGYPEILNEVYGVYNSFEEIDFNSLPSPCFIKCNSGSGVNTIYDRNKTFDKRYYRTRFNAALKHDWSRDSREWHYKDIEPKLVVEKIIRDKNGKLPLDYKFLCFDGIPKLLFLDLVVCDEEGHHTDDYPRNIYDMDFNLLPVLEQRPNADFTVNKPENFDRMIEIASKLSKPFPHCRVDLYNVDGNIFFGEITQFHGGGCNHIMPDEWDYRIGSWIDVDSVKESEYYVK